jgi:hypothetical protein
VAPDRDPGGLVRLSLSSTSTRTFVAIPAAVLTEQLLGRDLPDRPGRRAARLPGLPTDQPTAD